ncbi:hypothetical protein WA026_013213 [Henosepilachna vigintioctopunctata]|uniref:Gustatory receptor n=1 Tax=Henosepilachna vigintioctopunctata TaxID=420089 RepID=A0AAW1UED9_9CUCU
MWMFQNMQSENTTAKTWRAVYISEISDQMMLIGTGVMAFYIYLNIPYRVEELNLVCHLFDAKRFFGLNTIICARCAKKVTVYMKRCEYGILVVLSIAIGCELYCYKFKSITETLILPISFAQQYGVLMQINLKIILVQGIYKSMRKSLMATMNEKISRNISLTSMKNQKKEYFPSLKTKLGLTIHLYVELKKWSDLISKFLSMSNVIWISILSLQLIIQFYIGIAYDLFQSEDDQRLFLAFIIRTASSFYFGFSFLKNVEGLIRQSEDILRYIYKFPISKLNDEEMTKVEALFHTVISHRPVITVSNLFNIHAGLIPPICGVIITYVLVALQFRPVWIQK